jgi:hypothetical protein
MLFPLPMLLPGREVSQLAIVPIVCEPHFGTNEQYFLVMDNDSAVIVHVLMYYWPEISQISMSNIDRNKRRTFRYHRLCQIFHRLLGSSRVLPRNGEQCRLMKTL